MNEIKFPEMDEFYDRFCTAVRESGAEQEFLTKWGQENLSDVYAILSNNVQGGYDSHKQSMLAGPTGGSVLNIGPGMGFCVFLLSGLYDSVFVAEPDGESCSLIEQVTAHFPVSGDRKASDVVTVFHGGLSISDDAVKYWDMKQQLMKKRKLKGSILNFDIKGARELGEVFDGKVSRIYLHKVLSSLSIAGRFENIIAQCVSFLEAGGVLTWSEPRYIFEDILSTENEGDNTNDLQGILTPVFDKLNMAFEIIDYMVSNTDRDTETVIEEKWTLIKITR